MNGITSCQKTKTGSTNAAEKKYLIDNWHSIKLEYLFDIVCEKNDYLDEIFNNTVHWYYKLQHPVIEFVSNGKAQTSPAI